MNKRLALLSLFFCLCIEQKCFGQGKIKNDSLSVAYPAFEFFDDLKQQNKPRKNIFFKEPRWDSLKFLVEDAFKKFVSESSIEANYSNNDINLLSYFDSRCNNDNIRNKRKCFHLDSLASEKGFTLYFYLQFYGQYYTDYYESLTKPKVVTKQVQLLMKSYLLGFCAVVKDGKVVHTKAIDDIVNEYELKRYEKRELFFTEDRIKKMLQKLFESFSKSE